MIQNIRKKMSLKQKGFTLIELMIVIAIIGILAAIAVPQFLSYRMRSYNTAAKAIVNNLKGDNANLNAELGIFGHSEQTPLNLSQNDAAYVGPTNSNTVGMNVAATPAGAGARLSGSRMSDSRQMSVGISLGSNMWVDVPTAFDINDNSTYNAYARHHRGDSCYGVDADVENTLFSVTNAGVFPNSTTIAATTWPPVNATPPNDNLGGGAVAGNGAPTAFWTIVR